MDAGQKREELAKLARKLMDEKCCCYSELFECMEEDIRDLALEVKTSTGYIMACLIDDVIAQLEYDDEETEIYKAIKNDLPTTPRWSN